VNTYRVSYKVEGVRIVDVHLPDGVTPPKGFALWEYTEQDEWLWENQIGKSTYLEDIHFAEAESVLKVTHLKAVVNEQR
jgi:hypothetical protein